MASEQLVGDKLQVLFVEDDPRDATLTLHAITQASKRLQAHHVDNGEAALEFLRKEGVYVTAPRPDFILLDLKMPGMTGFEVLDHLKADAKFTSIPVVVLTNSRDPRDVEEAYARHAACYVVKPFDLDRFTQLVELAERFFTDVVTLNRGEGTVRCPT